MQDSLKTGNKKKLIYVICAIFIVSSLLWLGANNSTKKTYSACSGTLNADGTCNSCIYGSSASISGSAVYISISATGNYTQSSCCNYFSYMAYLNGYCYQSIKKASDSYGTYNYYYSTSAQYCVNGYSYYTSGGYCWKYTSTNPTTYTVTFIVGSGASFYVDGALQTRYDRTISTLNYASYTATKSGYTFKGWGSSASCTSGVASGSVAVTSAKTLYACWQPNQASCSYGTPSVSDVSGNLKAISTLSSGTASACCSKLGSSWGEYGTNKCLTSVTKSSVMDAYTYHTSSLLSCASGYSQYAVSGVLYCKKCPSGYTLNGSLCESTASPGSSSASPNPPSSSPSSSPASSSSRTPSSSSQSSSTTSSSDSPSDEPVIDNPQTGSTLIFIVWVVAFAAIGYSAWYYTKLKKSN